MEIEIGASVLVMIIGTLQLKIASEGFKLKMSKSASHVISICYRLHFSKASDLLWDLKINGIENTVFISHI